MKPIPALPPAQQQRIERLKADCSAVLDGYIGGFERDMNRHAVKHGPMDPARAHADVTRILIQQVADPANSLDWNMVAGLLSEAILRGVGAKTKGKG